MVHYYFQGVAKPPDNNAESCRAAAKGSGSVVVEKKGLKGIVHARLTYPEVKNVICHNTMNLLEKFEWLYISF